ncbi:ABC-three component system protein [Leisingera sp. ANG-M7]|uniref:ABC-three component system protein n=1 Tax=Leisingera sp. ANG-M7 TaxID=1577902 RepID=UPI0012698F95|nr:ABC-three component system protein [Leisingera sp. ANG-M7]
MSNHSQIPGLLRRLGKEIDEGGPGVEGFIDDLQMFQDHRSTSGVVGLKDKLTDAEREDEIESAELKKELFAKLLLRMQHYPSAQRIFALFLARINDVFEHHITPHASEAGMDRRAVDGIIEEKIVQPTLQDMGEGFEHFTINHAHVRGMIYWLADRCFVRWK